MKLSVLFAIAAASEEKKVPPRHPLQRLKRLVDFSDEILTDHFGFWKRRDKFIERFANSAGRMKEAFKRNDQKCGFYDAELLPHGGPDPDLEDRKRRELDFDDRYNREDPWEGARQITTGFRKWAERYIAGCNGQKEYKHMVNRYNKFYQLMIDALNEQ